MDKDYFSLKEIYHITYEDLLNAKTYEIINEDSLFFSTSRYVDRMPRMVSDFGPNLPRKISRRINLKTYYGSYKRHIFFKYLWVIQNDRVVMEDRLNNSNYTVFPEFINLTDEIKIITLVRFDSVSYLLQPDKILF